MSDAWGQTPGDDEPAAGEAAGGLVRIELDATGRVRDILFGVEAGSLPLEDLRSALLTAFGQAQDEARRRAARVAGSRYGDLPSRERLEAAFAQAQEQAERRFSEISTALYDLSRAAGRQW